MVSPRQRRAVVAWAETVYQVSRRRTVSDRLKFPTQCGVE